MTSCLSSISTYGTNPYVTTSLSNPFLLLPDNEMSFQAITEGDGLKFYIPKIDDLLEVVAAGKLHVFKGMITSRMFDLHKVSFKGETLISSLEKKGNQKEAYIKILAESGVNLRSLAPLEFWELGLKTKEKKIISLSLEKSFQARRVEKAIIASLKHLKTSNTSSNRRRIMRQITKHTPHIDLQRILNVAMSCSNLSLLVKGLLKKGSNPSSCRNALNFISEISAREDRVPSFLSAIIPARFPVTCFDVEEVPLPDGATAAKLHDASIHGFQEHTMRSQLFSLFGLCDRWAGTLDPLPRPVANISNSDRYHFFERIQNVVGYPEPPIFVSEHNSPISEGDWDLFTRDSERPIVFASGWTNHATVAVIVGDKLYKGNRFTFSKELSPGIYCTSIDRTKLTLELFDEIISNTNHLWFDYDLDLKLGGKPAELIGELKSQTHLNCTWASCAELSFYILQRHAGKTHRQAWLLVKAMKAKVRHSFLLSYLSHDRTHEPHLHSAPLLGAILAKCLFRERSGFPQYSMMIQAILDSGVSVDILQMMYSTNLKTKKGYYGSHALKSVTKKMGISPHEVFERLDPFYRKEESCYKAIVKAQDNHPLNLPSLPESFPVIDLLNDPLIPETYRVAIVTEKITPLCALMLFAKEESKSLPGSIKSALCSVIVKAGISDPEKFLASYHSLIDHIDSKNVQLKDIDYSDNDALITFVKAVIVIKNALPTFTPHRLTTKWMKCFDQFISILLIDPNTGFILTSEILAKNPPPVSLISICSEKDVFPDAPLLRNKAALREYLLSFLEFPGWDIDSKIRVLTKWIADEPFQSQVVLLEEILGVIKKMIPQEALLLTDGLILRIWEENPFIIHEVFLLILESHKNKKELLGYSQAFRRLANFLWDNDVDFMKSKLKEDIQNIALWSKQMRESLRKDDKMKMENLSNVPMIYADYKRAQYFFRDEQDVVAYLTSKNMFPFDKETTDHKE